MRREAPALVGVTALYATVADQGGFGDITIPWPGPQFSPEQAHVLLDSGPLVDIRAVEATARRWPIQTPPRESRWAVCVLAFYEDDAFTAMDEALDQLRKDIHAGRIEPGTHTGRPWPRNPLEPPAEALLAAYRESVLRTLERA